MNILNKCLNKINGITNKQLVYIPAAPNIKSWINIRFMSNFIVPAR
jgi:hypothetical protein